MNDYLLTIAISTGQNDGLLRRLLESLRRQTVSGGVQILMAAPSAGENLARVRNRMYQEARAPFVYFLDEDCEPPDEHWLERVLAELKTGAVGGSYLAGGGAWQTAYNALTSFWLDLHAHQGQSLPVAGNFGMPKIPGTGEGFPFALSVPFGGEEIRLRQALLAVGVEFSLKPSLSVLHNSSKTGATFFKRAWTHGSAPRMPAKTGAALSGLRRAFARVVDPRIRALMIAYLMTVVTARMAWHVLPKKTH
jgi:hypothetical protein